MNTENATHQKISELEEKKDIEGLKQIQQEAEMVFDGELAGIAEKAINRLNEKIESTVQTSESQVSQINEHGGSTEELGERTKDVDQKIIELKTETEEKIGEVQNDNPEEKVISSVNQEKLEEEKQKLERIKELDAEIAKLLDEVVSNLPNQIKSLVNSEAYNKIFSLNEKRKTEEKELFDLYNRYTQGHDDYRRSFSTHNLDYNGNQYVEDMKMAGASKEIVKRFEEFKEKFRKPELQAESDYSDLYREKINKPKWEFEKTLVSKSEEVFGKDESSSKEFKKKYFDLYRENLYKVTNEIMGDKTIYFNMAGTIYS